MRILLSVIIPHKDSLDTLPRLIDSIPEREDIEVIVIDNSTVHISKDEIKSSRTFNLLFSPPNRYAGGARNVGIKASKGKWLIFADADDFFTPNAFDVFLSLCDKEYELIYFKASGLYDDTLKYSDRGEEWSRIVDDYLSKKISEQEARLKYVVPWGKMISRDLVSENNIKFDEVLAANDVMFSTLCAYKAKSFLAVDEFVYFIIVRKGSLANRRDIGVIRSRYHVALRRNKFLREHNMGEFQSSVMYHIFNSTKFGFKTFLDFIRLAIHYKQNIFIGFTHWFKTYIYCKRRDKANINYITK